MHTCTIPRSVPLENAVELLNNVKNGDPSISLSAARKAGAVVGKLVPKDIAHGQKNPARRLQKIWKMPLAVQKQMLGDDVAAVIAEYK
eukprot:7492435-Heterocapsa_arctica.AAC.1